MVVSQCAHKMQYTIDFSLSLSFHVRRICNTWVGIRVLRLCVESRRCGKKNIHLRKPTKFQSRGKLLSFSEFLIMKCKSTARPDQRQRAKKRAVCYGTYTANDCGRIFFISVFSFLLLHMKTQQRKNLFLGLVSCQLSKTEDEIIRKRPEKEILFHRNKYTSVKF